LDTPPPPSHPRVSDWVRFVPSPFQISCDLLGSLQIFGNPTAKKCWCFPSKYYYITVENSHRFYTFLSLYTSDTSNVQYVSVLTYCSLYLKPDDASHRGWELHKLFFKSMFMCNRGSQRDVVYLVWPIAPSYMSPIAGGWGVVCEVSANEYWSWSAHGAQINFGDLTPYLTYYVHWIIGFAM
jgi:hypothetical protein